MKPLNNNGFTLIETLVVITIFLIGMAIAAPNLVNMGRRDAVKTDARRIKDNLTRARIEAIERNSWVTVAFRQATEDYVVFVDSTPPDYSFDGGEQVIETIPLAGSRFDVTQGGDGIQLAAGNCISWDTKGMPFSSGGGLAIGSISLIGTDGSTFRITTNQTGNIRIQ